MLRGIPFFGEQNKSIQETILSSNCNKVVNISLYDLAQLALLHKKNYVVVIGAKYLTWLDDIVFDYVHKCCYIQYYSYMEYVTDIYLAEKSFADRTKVHIKTDSEGRIVVRFNYNTEKEPIAIGFSLLVYSLQDNCLTKYIICSYCNMDFQLKTLYNLYLNSCYFDYKGAFTENESGYTYITKQFTGFSNQELLYRRKLNLPNYLDDEIPSDYCDVRQYDYWYYIDKYKNVTISKELYKYRRLAFESYLFCCIRAGLTPTDEPRWNKLGKSLSYIKIKDTVPFFVKQEWLDDYNVSKKTWRRV